MSIDHDNSSIVIPPVSARARSLEHAGAITIGRNIGTKPMPTERWRKFVASIEQLVRTHGGVVYLTAFGMGSWQDVIEEAAVITFEVRDISAIISRLPWHAMIYQQDAIALLIGSITLLDGRPVIRRGGPISVQRSLAQ